MVLLNVHPFLLILAPHPTPQIHNSYFFNQIIQICCISTVTVALADLTLSDIISNLSFNQHLQLHFNCQHLTRPTLSSYLTTTYRNVPYRIPYHKRSVQCKSLVVYVWARPYSILAKLYIIIPVKNKKIKNMHCRVYVLIAFCQNLKKLFLVLVLYLVFFWFYTWFYIWYYFDFIFGLI